MKKRNVTRTARRRSPDKLAEIVSKRLTHIENGLAPPNRVGIKVPKGVIRSVSDILPDYAFVRNQTLRRNICYAVEGLDFYRWLINRFRLYGPVAGYTYKIGIIIVDSVPEAMTRDLLDQKGVAPHKDHSKNIKKLERDCGIPTALCRRIRRTHERRSNIHLHLVRDLEATKYTLKDWNLAIRVLQAARREFTQQLGL